MSRTAWGLRLYWLLFCGLHLGGMLLFGLNMAGRFSPEPIMLRPNNLFEMFWSGPITLLAVVMGVWLTWLLLDRRHRPVLVKLLWRRGFGIFGGALLIGRLLAVLQLEPVVALLGASRARDIWANPILFFDLSYGGVDPLGLLWGGGLMIWLLLRRWSPPPDWGHLLYSGLVGTTSAFTLSLWSFFFGQIRFGAPTGLRWAVKIDPIFRPPQFAQFDRFQPLFFYLILYLLGGLLLLIWWRQHDIERTLFLALWLTFGLSWFGLAQLFPDFSLLITLLSTAGVSFLLWRLDSTQASF